METTGEGHTAQGRFASDADETEIDKLIEMLERYGAVDPAVSVGDGVLGVTAYYDKDREHAKLAMLDGLRWLPCIDIQILEGVL